MWDERWCVPGNRRGVPRECTERRSTFGKTAESSPSVLRYTSKLQLLIDSRKLIPLAFWQQPRNLVASFPCLGALFVRGNLWGRRFVADIAALSSLRR